ncbi:hypothetical protein SPRG_15121 [Saprolegnia parasitica CBS 223.65]|uniref:VLIG-type G domain-containing protein n=1 Tax=Saprolegnia parasitica (strain CBS 223.65) TaxID=695850 RepID=A0A067BXG8_SAPPC|nr:hypothetical protein SPRG_15121 [Saprolegnia parasitica CBS 223.65]KDO19247.1 hypothetical protein SPRG_15121 [Saprolegnia parasitica CBS 223.65]|eukprot:XP_012210052.1 hypothetical protein SPRG_15121 [Saprolegnia parasitica CBS 223.65]
MEIPANDDIGLTETLRQAVEASMHLQGAIRATNEAAINLAVGHFNKHASALALQHWVVDQSKLTDSTTLLQRLPVLEKMLTQMRCEVSVVGDAPSDDQVIARASGGAALFGHCFGFRGSSKGVAMTILQPPIECELEAPTMRTGIAEVWFASAVEAKAFCTAVRSSGHAKAPRDDTHLPPYMASVVQVNYACVPLKSFDLDVLSAPLTASAMAEAASVTDAASAKEFLYDFGSHVRSGIFHVGGIFWKTVDISTDVDVATAQLQAICPARLAAGDLSINYSSFPYQSRIDACERTLQNKLRTRCNVTTLIECTGPDALSVAIFQQRLALDRTTWHVIGFPTTRVGVWDLLAAAGLERAANLVRDAWLDLVSGCAMTPDVAAAVSAVYTDAWVADPAFGTECKRTNVSSADEAERTIAQMLDAATTGNVDGLALVEVILLALRFDSTLKGTVLVDCMRDPRLHTALRRLVAASDMTALTELGAIYGRVLGAVLATAGINLDATVDETLKRAGRLAELKKGVGKLLAPLYDWQVPEMDARDVPIALKLVHRAFSNAAMPDGVLLTRRVAELLIQNGTPAPPELWGIAQKFGCSKDGFAAKLNTAHVLAMADAMMLALHDGVAVNGSDDDMPPVQVKREAAPVVVDAPNTPALRSISHLLTVVSKPNKTTDLPGRLWYTLKHRLCLVKELYTTISGVKRKYADRRVQDDSPPGPVVSDALLTLVASLTPAARAQVHRLLLDRRYLVPFLVPSTGNGLRSEARALSLVETCLVDGRASLMRDTSVTRVAVVSEQPARSSKTKDWIKSVFHVDSVHCLDRAHSKNVTDAPVVAELGWGFVRNVQESTEFTTVMVLHVIGDYMHLEAFITQFADVLVVDAGSEPRMRMTLPRGTVLQWRVSDKYKNDIPLVQEAHMIAVALACPMSTSFQRISNYILREPSDAPKLPVGQLTLPSLVQREPPPRERVARLLADTDFATLRTETLVLQQRFARESALRSALQRETSVPNQELLRQQIASSTAVHKKIIRRVFRVPVLEYFMHVLERPTVADREMRLIDLERRLAECCKAIPAAAHDACSGAYAARSAVDNAATRSAYASAVETRSNMVTGVEHLWRELSHIFAADPDVYRELPRLAVQHLVDGFPLELMDGDAGMVNDKWIRAVLHCLEDTLPVNTRVFVLSVLGVQSSGKSTLLNCMFGVRLRTNVARCTRGVNLQLLACDNGGAYDYILLLDTEGLQSPEFVGVQGNVWRDNRMASVAILPADATIILTKGESTSTINDVLPIVLSAFANSELAAASGGHLSSKLYFVFNQIDVTQKRSMETSLQALVHSLRLNATKIAAVRKAQSATTFLRDFCTDITDEVRCDARFLGVTQGQTTPPNDVPLPDFGDRLVRFRDHIHTRAMDDGAWQARTFGKLSESFDLVWMCLQSADFELDFASTHQRVVYDQLVEAMAGHTHELAKIYSEAFDAVLQAMSADSAAKTAPNASCSGQYTTLLEDTVKKAVDTLDAVVATMLLEPAFAEWVLKMQDSWTDKKRHHASHTARLVESKVQHLFEFDAITKVYKEEIQTAIVDHNATCGPEKTLAALTASLTRLWTSGVFTPDELRLLASDDDEVGDVWRPLKHMPQGAEASREAEVVDAVRERVASDLAEVDRYADHAALLCVMNVKHLVNTMQLKPSELKTGLRTLELTLQAELQQRQERWDAANSVVAKFEAHRPSMLRFAQSVAEGQKTAQLLTTTLNEWLGRHLKKAFEEEVVSVVASALKDARWVCTPDAMQAALDMDLLQLMRKRDIDTVLDHIQRPAKLVADVTHRLVLAQVQACYVRVAKKLVLDVKECIGSASAAARDAVCQRSEVFVYTLRLTLQRRLKCSGTSALIESLPLVAGDVMNCDDQGPSAFDIDDGRSIPKSLLVCVAALDASLGPSAVLSSTITRKIVKVIRNEAYGAADGIMPRCGKPCPRCKCPCTKALGHAFRKKDTKAPSRASSKKATRGHVSTTEDNTLHDTYHQPGGLVGGYCVDTKQLYALSCAACVVENDYMVLSSGNRPYTDFPKVYRGWALPRVTKFLPLREYIFANCQPELARNHNMLQCATIPASYAHDLGDIEKQLERLLR